MRNAQDIFLKGNILFDWVAVEDTPKLLNTANTWNGKDDICLWIQMQKTDVGMKDEVMKLSLCLNAKPW